MARPLRIEYAGAIYHVTSRGDRREEIYLDEEDREIWLAVMAQVCERFNWRCHTWCMMDNHYHIVVETIEGNLSKGMRQLNGVYTQKSNRRHQRVGHVFQGRFKAILVDRDNYLLELCRYVVLNPVRAGIVNDVVDWPWSSYRAMISQESVPAWLETDAVLSYFGKRRKSVIAKYIDFVRSGVGLPSIWDDQSHSQYLGDETFIETIGQQYAPSNHGDLKEIPRIQRRPLARPLSYYVARTDNRKQAMAAAYASGDYSMKQIADTFGVHYSTVSRAVKGQETNVRDCKT